MYSSKNKQEQLAASGSRPRKTLETSEKDRKSRVASVKEVAKLFQTLEISRPLANLPPINTKDKMHRTDHFLASRLHSTKNSYRPRMNKTDMHTTAHLQTEAAAADHMAKTAGSSATRRTLFRKPLNQTVQTKRPAEDCAAKPFLECLDFSPSPKETNELSSDNASQRPRSVNMRKLERSAELSPLNRSTEEMPIDHFPSKRREERSRSTFTSKEKETIIRNTRKGNILDSIYEDEKEKSTMRDSTMNFRAKEQTLPGSKVLDLNKVRTDMLVNLKRQMDNDSRQSYLDELLHPIANPSKYYISELREQCAKCEKPELSSASHIAHFTYIMRVLKNKPVFSAKYDEEFEAHKQSVSRSFRDLFLNPNNNQLVRERMAAKKVVRFNELPYRDPEDHGRWLVLDLEGTLIRWSSVSGNGDFDLQFINHNGVRKRLKVEYRPFLLEFLERMKSIYNIMLYTTLSRSFTEKLLDLIT